MKEDNEDSSASPWREREKKAHFKLESETKSTTENHRMNDTESHIEFYGVKGSGFQPNGILGQVSQNMYLGGGRPPK